MEVSKSVEGQARRVVEFHQAHISDHLLKSCAGAGNEKPFRHTLSNGLDRPRRSRAGSERRGDYLLGDGRGESGPLDLRGRPVPPPVRLRRPLRAPGGRSCPPPVLGAGTSTPRASPRQLPPLVYEGIDSSLAGKRLPPTWFADPWALQAEEPDRQPPTQTDTGDKEVGPKDDEAFREEASAPSEQKENEAEEAATSQSRLQAAALGLGDVEVFDPPLRARGLYVLAGAEKTEWRPCEVLAFSRTEQQFLIQWFCSGLQKRVSTLQLRFDGESEATAIRRRAEAESRRDTVEAMMLEQVVVEELSRWEQEADIGTATSARGNSAKRILDLAQLTRYEASDEVVQALVREAAESYSRSQAKWLLLWRRPDLQEYLGIKPVPLPEKSPWCAILDGTSDGDSGPSEPRLSLDVSATEEVPPARPSRPPRPREKREEPPPRSAERGTLGISKGPGGIRGNLAPNRKFRNLPSPLVVQKSQELAAVSLIGESDPQSRLLQVYDVVGKLYTDDCTPLYCPARKREPYSLQSFSRSMSDGFSRSASFYRITWPESITLFYMSETGVVSPCWTQRSSGLIARLMEAGLHNLCLQNLKSLLTLMEGYAKLSKARYEGLLELTYLPPLVYQRMALVSYEQHPLFRIQVIVERSEKPFVPSLELAIEAFFASADTKSLEILLHRKNFANTVQSVVQKHLSEIAKVDMQPDGGAFGGAPSANHLAIQKNIVHWAAQLASGAQQAAEDAEESEEEQAGSSRPGLLQRAASKHLKDDRVLFEDPEGELVVKLTAHPKEFRGVLGEHFRKIVDLTERFTRIDGSLEQDGEVQQKFIASLSEVKPWLVEELQEKFDESLRGCFFNAEEVVHEVGRYNALLRRFSKQALQLSRLLREPQRKVHEEGDAPSVASSDDHVLAPAEDREGPSVSASEAEVSSLQSEPTGDGEEEDRFAAGLLGSVEEVRENLDRLDEWAQEINESQELNERHLGLFVVDVSPLRKALLAMCACCRLRLLGVVQRWLEDACARLKLSLQSKSTEIVMAPKQPDELHSTIEAVKSLGPFLAEMEPVLGSIRQMFDVLESRCHQVPRPLIKRWYECIHAVPDLRDRAERWQNTFRKDLRGKFNMKIAEKAKFLAAQVEECRLVLEEYACKVSLNRADLYYTKMKKLQERVCKLQEQVKKQHVHEEMMEMPLSDFPGLAATAEQLAPLLDLWYLAHEWTHWKENILFDYFVKIDPSAVKHKLLTCTETMRYLEEVFTTQPRPRQVLHSLSLDLAELRVLVPVIVSLRNPGLRDRHWQRIGEAMGQTIQASQMKEITLSTMNERYPFVAHLSKIQAISDTASKEMVIEDELKRMQDQWTKLKFQIKPVSRMEDGEAVEDEMPTVMAEFHHEQVWELIAEQAAKVRSLGHRPNAAVHAQALVAHDAKLKAIGELVDLLEESQFGYLAAREHMMNEGLVKDLMQRDTERNKEWKRFFDVEKQWQGTLNHLRSAHSYLELLDQKITVNCREAAVSMERIQRSIHDVLDLRRAKVPNLYRLSDAALMKVLRFGHNPAEPAIRDCLPGVLTLDVSASTFSDGKSVRAIVGDSGEYLSLPEEVLVQEGSQIEDWLPKLLDMMSRLLRWTLSGLMLSNFGPSDARLLDEKYALQVRSAALDLAYTSEIESVLSESGSGTLLQQTRLAICQMIDQLQEKRIQGVEAEGRGADFEGFIEEESSEEEEEEESEQTESDTDSDMDDEEDMEEGDEEEELSEDESVSAEEASAADNTVERTMTARKAVRLEPPLMSPSHRASTLVDSKAPGGDPRGSGGAKPKSRRYNAAAKHLPETVLAKMPWRLFQQGISVAVLQMLRWREVCEQLENEREGGTPWRNPLGSYRWLTTLRHYLRFQSAPATPAGGAESYLDRGHYVLALAGLELDYAWQYLGAFGPAGRMYWDPQTDRGQLVMANAFATARGVLSTNPGVDARSEAAATIARSLGVVQEKIVVNWQSSVASVWRHLEGALLAGLCLAVTIDSSVHVQVLAVLAQELHSHFNTVRANMGQAGGASPRRGWVHLECHEQGLRGPQPLPMLLLRTFRPTSLPAPSLDALCELWLLSSGIRPTIAKSTSRAAAFAWRFLESAGAETKAGLFRSLPLWQLRILCEVTAKVMQKVKTTRRGKGRVSSVFGSDTRRGSRSGSASGGMDSQVIGSSQGLFAGLDQSISPDKMRRVSGAGMLLQETLAPTWARASLVQGFKICFFGEQSSWASELYKLLHIYKEDEEKVEAGALHSELTSAAKTVLEEMGLVGHPEHVQAVHRLNLWVNLCHSETDLVVGAPSTRAVLVLGATAVGKSTCVDALAKLPAKDGEQPWELRRVNAASLALDASDSLLRPVAGTSRLQPSSSSSGVLQQIEGKKSPTKSRKVLVHVDGELAPSLHGAFLASLCNVSSPGCTMRQGLQLSAQSWIHLRAPSSLSRLGIAFEMGAEGSRTLSPDLVSRCGVVHLPTEEDFRKELELLVSGFGAEAERLYESANVSSTVTRLCEWVILPLLIFLFRDEEMAVAGEEEACPSFCAALKHVKEALAPSNEKAAATTGRKTAGKKKLASQLKSLENARMLDAIPRRVLFCRIRDAFFAVYNHSCRVQREARQQQLELDAQAEADRIAARSRLGTELDGLSRSRFASDNAETVGLSSAVMLLPSSRAGSRRPSRAPSRQADASAEASPTESSTVRRRSSTERWMAKKVAAGLLAPGAEAKEEEVVMLDVEASVALVFATMSTLSAVARDGAMGVLEDALHRLVELLGAPAANLRLPVEFSILDAVPDEQLKGFYHLDSFLKEPDTADMDAYVFVPTTKSKRFVSLATVLGRSQTHLALLGPPGSGKSSLLSQTIAQLPLRETPSTLPTTYSSHCCKVSPTSGFGTRVELLYMCATHWLPAGRWERILQQNLVRTSQHGLSPRLYSWCLFVIDDCHCAPPTLREAWRFAMERGLVHSPGARGMPPPKRAAVPETPGKRVAERAEREAAAPSIRRIEGVMMLLAARSASALAQRQNFMRHVWAFTLEPLQEAELLKIVGDNMSHFIFVKDIATRVEQKKMFHVRLLHSLMMKLQETQSATRLISPHVLFRFFKGLLSQPTECLCDLQPQDFHEFFLHELLRETRDRLPLHRQKSVTLELARLQLSMFGGLDSDGELCAAPEASLAGPVEDNHSEGSEEDVQLRGICEKLEALAFSSLGAATNPSTINPQRVERLANYSDISGQLPELRSAIRADLQRGWSRAKVMSNEVSALMSALHYWAGPEHQMPDIDHPKPENPLRGCAGLEPRHLLLSDEYLTALLRIGRLMELVSSPSRCKVWDRSGGKTLLFAPSVAVAISLLRGLCFFHGLRFDTPFGLPGSEGADEGGTGSLPGFHASAASAMLGHSHETLRDVSVAQPPTADAEAFRSWLKEKLLSAVSEACRWLLCIPPALINQTEVLAVLHEAFAQEGPPSGWFNEREAKDCEAAVGSLDPEKRWVAHLVLQEDEGFLPSLDVFWAEALGRVQFVLLASTSVPEDRLSASQLTPSILDAYCPSLLQQLAVIQLPSPSADAYVSTAKVQLESPILDFDTWQPDSPHKADLDASLIAEGAAALVRAAHSVAAHQPAGMSPRPLRGSQDLGDAGPTGPAQAPRLPVANSTWYGEAVNSGLPLPPAGSLGDVSDLLTLAQGLSRHKGAELHRRYVLIKDSQSLLQQLHNAVATSAGSEIQAKLTEAQSSHQEAQTAYEEKSAEHKVLHDRLTQLLDEVVNTCIQKSSALEAAENSKQQVERDLEAHRFQLINFSKQDYAELKKALNQSCPTGEEKERSPLIALFEMCCLLLRASAAPTREDIRSTIGDPLFATKLAAVDVESFPGDLLPVLADAAAVADTRDYMDVKALAAVANVAFPAYQCVSHSLKMPALKAELKQLEKTRAERTPEVEALQAQTHELAEEAKQREAEAQKLQQEMETCEGLASNAVEQKTRMGLMSQGLRHDRIRWGWSLQELSRQLAALPGDTLLTSAAALFAGPFGPMHREELMAHWKAILDKLSIPHSKELDLPRYWIPATARCRWHADLELPKDNHLEESIVLACLQTTAWPVFYDPDALAVPFLTKCFPGSHRLSMGSADFQKEMLSALQRSSGTGGDAADDVAAHVLIIENAYLPAIREMDLLNELLSRRQLRAAGLLSKGASIALTQTGVEDAAVAVDPTTIIIFVTQMAEPFGRDLLSTDFAIFDFRLSREPQCQGPLLDMLSSAVCEKALPTVHQELKQLGCEFAPLIDEWQRLDVDLAGRLSAHLHSVGSLAEGNYPSEEQVRDVMNVKMALESVGRRLLKHRDSEAKSLQQRSVNDHLVASLFSLVTAADELFSICPSCNVSLAGSARLVASLLPELPSAEGAKKPKGRADTDYAAAARRAVLAGLWERAQPGLPQQLILPAALRLATASAVPQRGLQELLGKLLLQSPSAEPALLRLDLNGALCSAIQAVLKGKPLLEALQALRHAAPQAQETPRGSPNPRASFSVLYSNPSSRSVSKSSRCNSSRLHSKTLSSVARGVVTMGAFARALHEEVDKLDERPVSAASAVRRNSAAQEALRAAGAAHAQSNELLQQLFSSKGHWEKCNAKTTFLARFCYFQEAFRNLLEQVLEEQESSQGAEVEGAESQSKDATAFVLADLLRISRFDLFGVDEKYLENLLNDSSHDKKQTGQSQRMMVQRQSSARTLNGEAEEGAAEGGADTPGVLAILFQCLAMGGPAPSAVSVSVDGISLGFLADRFEDSVAGDAAAWARWADAVASGALRGDGGSRRGGALNSGHTMMEHLPLLASLPHDLISSLLPQGFGLGPGGVTLRATSAGAVLQTMLFAVLASHSLGAVLAGAEAFVAGLTGMPAPCRRPRLSTLVEAAGATQPVVCLCETEASPAVDDLQDMARRGQRKMVQVALGLQASPTADSAKAGVPAGEQPNRWGASGPVATAAATSASVLELVDECKDVGYWLLLHIVPQDTPKPSAAESTGVAPGACGGWELLEWIWFNMSTPAFRAAVDENFRLFVVVDARQPQLLPDWIFRSSCDAICVFDSQTGLSLRPWLELSLNSLRRKTPLMPEISAQATTPTNSKGKYDLLGGYKSLQDAASNSRLAAQGRMARITSSTVLFSRLTQPSFVLKLGLTALRLSLQLVLAAVAACERATCLSAAWLMRARPIGGLDADLADEALHRLIQLQGFEASVTIRSVDVLEIVATLIVHQAEEVGPLWVDVGGNPGPGASPILYNMLRFFRQSHLSRHRQDTTGPPPSADSSKMSQLSSLEASKRTSTHRNSSLNVLSAVGRKSKKPMEVEAIVDEALWYHDENYEASEGSLWTIFGQVADLVDDLLSKGEPGQPLLSDEADTAAAAEILKLLPLVDHHSTVRLAGAAPQVFALALPFARARPGQLHLPPLPSLKEPSERSSSASLPMMGEDASVASEEVDEVQDGQDGLDASIASRKVSGVETLQFQIPSIGVVPSASSEESEDDVEGLLAQHLFDMESQSASKEGLIHLLKATIACISSSGLYEDEAEEEPVGSESSLQAEWRRQRAGIASWARGICREAEDLVRGLREGLDTLSPELTLKLRHLLHTAQVWAMRAAPQEAAEISPPPRHLGDCPAEVWLVAKSPLALSTPVPDGWQAPDYLEEASFGAWLGRLAERLHQVYLPRDVPKRLHVADLGQVAPMLLALRLDFAAQRRCLAEQTCLVFLPVGQDEEVPSSPRSDLLKGEKCVVEDFTTWDELDMDKPPCFQPASELPSSLMAALAPLKHRGKDDNLASEVLRPPSPPMTPQKSAPPRMFAEETPPSARAAGATLKQSVRKIQILGALSGKATRRQSVAVRKKAKDTKENKIFHKDLANSDLILTGLLADGAVWSSVSGLYIDGNVAGLTRLPPLRAVATTLRTAEQFTAQCFPQASGCINLTVYRVMSTSWPMPPQGSLKSAPPREVCAIRLPFVTRSGFKWQPLALLDALPPQPCRGHLRQWATAGSRDNEEVHGSIADQLQEPLSLPRPFALHPEALPALAGPPNISTRIAKQSIPD